MSKYHSYDVFLCVVISMLLAMPGGTAPILEEAGRLAKAAAHPRHAKEVAQPEPHYKYQVTDNFGSESPYVYQEPDTLGRNVASHVGTVMQSTGLTQLNSALTIATGISSRDNSIKPGQTLK